MKRLVVFTLIIAYLTLSSFVRFDDINSKGSSFYASINNELYSLRNEPSVVVSPASSALMLNSSSNSIVEINFPGPVYTSREGKRFEENIRFKIGYPFDDKGAPNYYATMNYQCTTYRLMKDESKVDITNMALSGDGKTVIISASFECKMRSYGYPSDGKRDIVLKGKMENMVIVSGEVADRTSAQN